MVARREAGAAARLARDAAIVRRALEYRARLAAENAIEARDGLEREVGRMGADPELRSRLLMRTLRGKPEQIAWVAARLFF